MKVIQVIASLDSQASGPSYSVPRLARALVTLGVDSEVFATGGEQVPHATNFKLQFERTPLGRLHFSSELARALSAAAKSHAILHTHGLWLMPNLYGAFAARRHPQAPVIYSPRGMLAPAALTFSKFKKELFWHLAQKKALSRATCFHATSIHEAEDIRRAGLNAPIAIIPNGIDVPYIPSKQERAPSRTVLHLGRLHPKKGTHKLIEAWIRIQSTFPTWTLRIVGPSEKGYVERLQQQANRGAARVTFEDGLYGAERLQAYCSAELFVLPTLNENFGLVVAEALAAGTPVICSKGAPWSGLHHHRCGWWIDHSVDSLELALRAAMSLSDTERSLMGARGRSWMAAEFSWESVARSMRSVYRWALGGAERPLCLVAD